ncbi:MAG: hypothetical protein ACPHS8_06550 [Candidatus Poseidoniaceae archaeon]
MTEIDFQVACDFRDDKFFCEVFCSEIDCLFAYYISINEEIVDKIWYSKNKSIVYDVCDYIVNTYEVIFFIKNAQNHISIKSIRRRSHWSICDGILATVALLSKDGDKLLEFGSGFGSQLLSEYCIVTSVEHDLKFLGLFPEVTYINAEIIDYDTIESNPSPRKWYNIDAISPHLEGGYDLILLDGPTSEIGREGILTHLDKFSGTPLWIIDDVLREKDQKISNQICLKLGLIQYRFWNFSILSKFSIDGAIIEEIHKTTLEVLSNQSKDYLDRYLGLGGY